MEACEWNNIAEGSPAYFLSTENNESPKVRPGDIIRNVDGSSCEGLSAEEVAALIRGRRAPKPQ